MSARIYIGSIMELYGELLDIKEMFVQEIGQMGKYKKTPGDSIIIDKLGNIEVRYADMIDFSIVVNDFLNMIDHMELDSGDNTANKLHLGQIVTSAKSLRDDLAKWGGISTSFALTRLDQLIKYLECKTEFKI